MRYNHGDFKDIETFEIWNQSMLDCFVGLHRCLFLLVKPDLGAVPRAEVGQASRAGQCPIGQRETLADYGNDASAELEGFTSDSVSWTFLSLQTRKGGYLGRSIRHHGKSSGHVSDWELPFPAARLI